MVATNKLLVLIGLIYNPLLQRKLHLFVHEYLVGKDSLFEQAVQKLLLIFI